jgi:hypothetical protein
VHLAGVGGRCLHHRTLACSRGRQRTNVTPAARPNYDEDRAVKAGASNAAESFVAWLKFSGTRQSWRRGLISGLPRLRKWPSALCGLRMTRNPGSRRNNPQRCETVFHSLRSHPETNTGYQWPRSNNGVRSCLRSSSTQFTAKFSGPRCPEYTGSQPTEALRAIVDCRA